MAQLGDFPRPRARELLRRAARSFGAHEGLARARCVVAACAPAPSGGCWRAGWCFSCWLARSPRRGPAMSIGMR
jgi:hypothetical protein